MFSEKEEGNGDLQLREGLGESEELERLGLANEDNNSVRLSKTSVSGNKETGSTAVRRDTGSSSGSVAGSSSGSVSGSTSVSSAIKI